MMTGFSRPRRQALELATAAKSLLEDDAALSGNMLSGTVPIGHVVFSFCGSKTGSWRRFVGQCAGLPRGFWVGIEYDEPVGKNDGSVKGTRYFDCLAGYGGFVRPSLVTQGDYPPADDICFSDADEI